MESVVGVLREVNGLKPANRCILFYEVTIKQTSVGKSQILSSRRLLANLKYYQADVCWQISTTIKQTTVGKSKILSSRRRDVTQATLIFRKTMLRNTMISNSVRWRQ